MKQEYNWVHEMEKIISLTTVDVETEFGVEESLWSIIKFESIEKREEFKEKLLEKMDELQEDFEVLSFNEYFLYPELKKNLIDNLK